MSEIPETTYAQQCADEVLRVNLIRKERALNTLLLTRIQICVENKNDFDARRLAEIYNLLNFPGLGVVKSTSN